MANLTAGEAAIVNVYKVKPTTNFVKLVRMPTSFSELNNFEFRPLGEEGTLRAIKSTVDANDEEIQSSWVGNFDNGRGHMILFSSANGKMGSLFYDDKSIEIFSIREDLAIYVQNDNRKYPESKCANSAKAPVDGAFCEDNSNCSAVIDVLVIVHSAALSLFDPIGNPTVDPGDLGFLSQTAFISLKMKTEIARTNLAFKNSDILNKKVRLVGIKYIDIPLDPNPISDPNEAMRLDKAKIISNPLAKQWRKETKADIVLFITNQQYTNNNGLSTQFPAPASQAFAIVEASTIGNNVTFTHETGHLLGTGDINPLSDADCGQPHWFTSSGLVGRSTIMGYASNRVLYFSNSEVSINTEKTGVAGKEENARKIKNSACYVAANSDNPDSGIFNFIDGNSTMCCNCTGKYSVYTTYALTSPNLSYFWEWSIDNSFSNPTIISSTSKTIDVPAYTNDFFYLRGTITLPSGIKVTAIKRIDILYQPWICGAIPKSVSNITITPNPTDEDLNLTYDSDTDDVVRMSIISSSGTTVQTNQLKTIRGTNIYTIPLEDVPAGYYYLRFVTSSATITSSFIKN